MAELEASEFAVSKQGETMHVIGKVARLNWNCADRGGTLKTWGYPSFFSLRLIGQIMCLILGVGAGQRPFFMGKVIRIDFPARTKSVSGY